jgi:hypothetical protein
MTDPTTARRRFIAKQEQEAIDLCRQEDLSCNAFVQNLGLPSTSLAL